VTSRPALWGLGSAALVVAAACAATAVGPALTLAALGAAGIALWGMLAEKKTVAATLASVLVLIVVVVPVNRLGEGADALKVGTPAAILFLTLVLALRFRVRITATALCLAAYLGIYALATSVRPDNNQWALFALIAAVSVSGFIAGQVVASTGTWKSVARVIVLIASAHSAYAVAEVTLRLAPLWQEGATQGGRSELLVGYTRAQGTYGSALLLCFVSLLALVIVMRNEIPARPALRGLVVILLFVGLVAAGGRSALLLALVIWLLGNGRPVARFVKVMATGLIGVVFLLPLLGDTISRFMGTGSFTHRIGAFESVGNLLSHRDFISNAIGDGAGSTVRLYQMGLLQNDGLQAVDNQLVLTLIETGFIGLGLLALVFVRSLRAASGATRLALAIVVIEFFVFDALAWASSAFLIWMLIGLVDSTRSDEDSHGPSDYKSAGVSMIPSSSAALGSVSSASAP
jgi:hypothetical protein